jgi:1-acyl-sn-glycerol-3-phosphate acyltransferase
VRVLCAIARMGAHLYHKLTVRTPSTLPRTGPAILVCNHISVIDPGIVQSACRRPIIWMMAGEYLEIRWLQPLFSGIGVIPVARGQRDSASTRAALRALNAGRILGIFPEGRINPGTELLPFHPGAATLADRTGVPVIPAYLDGTTRGTSMLQSALQRQEMRLRFGPPLRDKVEPRSVDGRSTYEAITAAVRSLQLSEQAQYRTERGVHR